MDDHDSVQFLKRLNGLANYFDVELSATRQAQYFEGLCDLPFEAVEQALAQALKTCTFFPKVAELRSFIIGDTEDRAELAWMAMRRAMRTVGAYSTLVTADPVLGETIMAVFESWPAACVADLSPEMWSSTRKEFGRVYRVVSARQPVGRRVLPGLVEAANAGRDDWQKYVPFHLVHGEGIRALAPEEIRALRPAPAKQLVGHVQDDSPKPLSESARSLRAKLQHILEHKHELHDVPMAELMPRIESGE